MRRVLLLLGILGAAYLGWHHATEYPLRSADDPPFALIVPPGASTDSIGRQLQGLGLVPHPLFFRVALRWHGGGGHLKAGEYRIEGPVSLVQIIDLMARGEVVRHEVTFPEGRSLTEMAALASGHGLNAEAFLRAARDPALVRDLDPDAPDLEGYLFPDTYEVPLRPDASAAIVGLMVRRFREVVAPHRAQLVERGLTFRQLVTLASLVELETAQPDERPRIAAVFLNRLQKGMLLQTDPTVIFALRKAGTYDGNIHKKDLDVDSPYNTYRRPGLPPGPIASPGREAIEAVLNPAPAKDLYFVSRNDGTHQFSETLVDHERAVDRYQRQRAGRPLPAPGTVAPVRPRAGA